MRNWLYRYVTPIAFAVMLLAGVSLVYAAPPYSQNTSGTTLDGIHEGMTEQGTGATPGFLITAATTNCASLKSSAGRLYSVTASTTGNVVNWIKFYDTSSTPFAPTGTVKLSFRMPVTGTTTGADLRNPLPSVGVAFSNGIGICVTAGAEATNNSAGQLGQTINYIYK